MSTLSTKDIDRIANLAKLTIPQQENTALLKELNKILNLVEKMNTTDTSQIPPLAHPYDEKQPLRNDIVTEPDQRILLQKNAPQVEAGLYIVPAVINNDDHNDE